MPPILSAPYHLYAFKKDAPVASLTLGKVLGHGGFCMVSVITNLRVENDDLPDSCLKRKRECRYVLKELHANSQKDATGFVNGIADLAIEARFLSVIKHPHIIKMRAMASTSPFSVDVPFFVVLDRLYDMLEARTLKWKKKLAFIKLTDRHGVKERALWEKRMTVALDIASALQHLHSLK